MSKVIPSGYSAIFHMNTSPIGWTKDIVNNNNSSLRVVTGPTSVGGTIDFSTVFTSNANIPINVVGNTSSVVISNHTILQAELPAHTHIANGNITNTNQAGSFFSRSPESGTALELSNNYITKSTSSAGSSSPVAHTHSLGTLLSGLSFSPINLNLNVRYVDVIRATRD